MEEGCGIPAVERRRHGTGSVHAADRPRMEDHPRGIQLEDVARGGDRGDPVFQCVHRYLVVRPPGIVMHRAQSGDICRAELNHARGARVYQFQRDYTERGDGRLPIVGR